MKGGLAVRAIVDAFTETECVLRCSAASELHVNEIFMINVRKEGGAVFLATLAEQTWPEQIEIGEVDPWIDTNWPVIATFKIKSGVRTFGARKQARHQKVCPITVSVADREVTGGTTDVSRKGIGMLSPHPLKVGADAEVQIQTDRGLVKAGATVRSCSRDEDVAGHFRVGLEFTALTTFDEHILCPFDNAA